MGQPKFSREQLAVAAGFAWCMNDFLDKLEERNTPRIRRNMWARLRRLAIDVEHWDRSPRRWYSDEQLAAAARRSISYAGVLRDLGVPVTGGQHAHLARRIRAAGIDTSHFLGQAHYRGTSRPRRAPDEILVVRPPESGRQDASTLRRALLAIGVSHECAICGIGASWRGSPLILIVDHINGDYRDNRRENLRFLCPNCHSQTATWCRKPRASPPSYPQGDKRA
jgi:5-methylcytosine-specific restriction endonuclease McrA